ncbi:hypothetical protein [Nonomuraea sp. B19D2]
MISHLTTGGRLCGPLWWSLDIKPYMAEFGPQGPTVQPEWATELMRTYY